MKAQLNVTSTCFQRQGSDHSLRNQQMQKPGNTIKKRSLHLTLPLIRETDTWDAYAYREKLYTQKLVETCIAVRSVALETKTRNSSMGLKRQVCGKTLLTGLRNEDDRSLLEPDAFSHDRRKILASHEQVAPYDVDSRPTTAPHRPRQDSSAYLGTSVEPAVFANTPWSNVAKTGQPWTCTCLHRF